MKKKNILEWYHKSIARRSAHDNLQGLYTAEAKNVYKVYVETFPSEHQFVNVYFLYVNHAHTPHMLALSFKKIQKECMKLENATV